MSGSRTMSENMVSSEFYELVSDVKEEIVNSDDNREISFGGPHDKQVQHERYSNSALEVEKFNRDIFQIEAPSIGDEIDIKYEMNGTSTSTVEDDLDTGPILSKPLNIESINSEEKELNQLYLNLLQCVRDCETCQKYIRILNEHVKTSHAKDEPTLDPLHIESLDMNPSQAIEIKCEGDVEIKTMGCSEECDSNFKSEIQSDNNSDPDYKADQSPVNGIKCDVVKRTERMDCSSEETDSNSDYVVESESESDSDSDYNASSPELKRKRTSGQKLDKDGGKKPFKCELCPMTFARNSILITHFRSHTGEKPFKCEECVQAFARKDKLTLHMSIHTGVGLHKCKECKKSFATRSRLTTHLTSHTGDRPRAHKCEQCEKCFTTKRDLTMHMMTHTGDRPFKCDQCSSSFTNSSNLTVHSRSHTGERPYTCEQCRMGFKTSSHLKRHQKTHI